jgi:hypothetical protein
MKNIKIDLNYSNITIDFTFNYLFVTLVYILYIYIFYTYDLKNKVKETIEELNLKYIYINLITNNNIITPDNSDNQYNFDTKFKNKINFKKNVRFFFKTLYFYLGTAFILLFINLYFYFYLNEDYVKEFNKLFIKNKYGIKNMYIKILISICIGLIMCLVIYFISNVIILPYLIFKNINYFKKVRNFLLKDNQDASNINKELNYRIENLIENKLKTKTNNDN